MPSTMYPPVPPTVAGGKITIDLYLRQPTRITRVLNDLTAERFIGDRVFGSGNADGGAVLYDRVSEQDLYLDNEIEVIAPGAEFPILGASETDPLVAKVAKRGGAVKLTYEAVRRNATDQFARQMRRLANTIVKKHDAIAISTLLGDADLGSGNAAAAWNASGSDPFADIMEAKLGVEQLDLGYLVDTAIINPQEFQALIANASIRAALPRENTTQNPVLSGQLAGLAGIANWIVTNRMTSGTALFVNSKIVGSINDELPMYTRVVDKQEDETYLIQGARVSVPVVTDPKAAFKLTGLHS